MKEEIKYCKRGHPRTPENLDKKRYCKECSKLRQQARSKTEEYREYMKDYQRKQRRAKGILERAKGQQLTCKERSARARVANPEKHREYARKWAREHPEARTSWLNKNKDKRKEIANKYARKAWLDLKDSCIASNLKIKLNECPVELIELKRNQILTKRALKELKQALKG